jgi:hypothetical protein
MIIWISVRLNLHRSGYSLPSSCTSLHRPTLVLLVVCRSSLVWMTWIFFARPVTWIWLDVSRWRVRLASPRLSLCPACLKQLLCSGDGIGAPGTVLGRARRKGLLGRTVGTDFLSGASQIPLGAALGDVAGDALRQMTPRYRPQTFWCRDLAECFDVFPNAPYSERVNLRLCFLISSMYAS